jgi:hypothetical protein
MKLLPLLPPLQAQRDPVGPEQRPEIGIVMVALCRYFDQNLISCIVIAADEREGRIAPEQLALVRIDHATARTMHRVELDFVKALH